MTDFKKGDRIRLSAGASRSRREGNDFAPGVGDTHGTITEPEHYGRVMVLWDGGALNCWNNPPVHEIELVPGYDQDTVNAIVRHLRDRSWYTAAEHVVEKFVEPKMHTVAVNFQVPEGKSVVDYLENVGIDYDIEGGN